MYDFALPALGESSTEGTVSRWLKQIGESVAAGEAIVEISTDKVDAEIPSPVAGILVEIRAREDETIAVGAPLAVIQNSLPSAQGVTPTIPDPTYWPSSPAATAMPSPERSYDFFTSATPAVPAAPTVPAASSVPTVPATQAPAVPTVPAVPAVPHPVTPTPVTPTPVTPVSTPPPVPSVPFGPGAETMLPVNPLPAFPATAAVPATPPTAATVPPAPIPPTMVAPTAVPSPTTPPTAVPSTPSVAIGQVTTDLSFLSASPTTLPPASHLPHTVAPPAQVQFPPQGAAPLQVQIPSPGAGSFPATPASPGAGSAVTPAVTTPTEASIPYVTPLVRKLADEYGVDLSTIRGSGVGGRIRKQDILDAAVCAPAISGPNSGFTDHDSDTSFSPSANADAPWSPVANPEGPVSPTAPDDPTATPMDPADPSPAWSPETSPATSSSSNQPKGMESVAQPSTDLATESLPEAQAPASPPSGAQLSVTVEADFTRIVQFAGVAEASRNDEAVRAIPLSFVAESIIEALRAHPMLNATVDPASGTISYLDNPCLGITVNSPTGMIVPVIRDAADLSRTGLEKKIVDLVARASSGQLTPEEVSGGTFTVTNYGSAGMLFGTASIQGSQTAILGIGAITRRPVVMNDLTLGEIVTVRDKAYLCLSYDPRAVTEADAVSFLATVKTRIEVG